MAAGSIFNETDYEILQTLIGFIKENAPEPRKITYKELAGLVDNPSVIPINMGSHLGRIGEVISATNNLTHAPIPNSIVVNQGTDKAGDGYDELMRSISKSEPSIQDIYDYKNWDLILDLAKGKVGKPV